MRRLESVSGTEHKTPSGIGTSALDIGLNGLGCISKEHGAESPLVLSLVSVVARIVRVAISDWPDQGEERHDLDKRRPCSRVPRSNSPWRWRLRRLDPSGFERSVHRYRSQSSSRLPARLVNIRPRGCCCPNLDRPPGSLHTDCPVRATIFRTMASILGPPRLWLHGRSCPTILPTTSVSPRFAV